MKPDVFEAVRRFEREKLAVESVTALIKAAFECARLHDEAGMVYPEPLRRILGAAAPVAVAIATGGES